MAVPRFAAYSPYAGAQQSPATAIQQALGALEQIPIQKEAQKKRKDEQEKREAEKEEFQEKFLQLREKGERERQRFEHEQTLQPYEREIAQQKAEQAKVPLEELSKLNYKRKQALSQNEPEMAKNYQSMMHDYAATHYIQGDARDIRGHMRVRDRLAGEGKVEEAEKMDKVVQAQIAAKLNVKETELEKQQIKDMSVYSKDAYENAGNAKAAIDDIDTFVKHFKETPPVFQGGKVAPNWWVGRSMRDLAYVGNYNYRMMMKSVSRLQQESLKSLKPGRIAKHIQDMVASGTLDPSLGEEGVATVSAELKSGLELMRIKAKFIQASQENGIKDPLAIENAWTTYTDENPAVDKPRLVEGKHVYDLNKKNLSEKMWGKYVPRGTMATEGAENGYSDEDLEYTAKQMGISKEEVLKRLKERERV